MSEAPAPLYRRVLGRRFDGLPRQIRELHDVRGLGRASGTCDIDRGSNPIARLVGWIFKMPPGGANVPVKVTFVSRDGREVWRRDFGGARFQTVQQACPDKPGHLIERFGAMAFLLEIQANEAGLGLELRRVSLLGIPLPRGLWPRIEAGERVVDGDFAFDVALRLPMVGLMIHYRGTLRAEATHGASQPAPIGPAV